MEVLKGRHTQATMEVFVASNASCWCTVLGTFLWDCSLYTAQDDSIQKLIFYVVPKKFQAFQNDLVFAYISFIIL
jgi:hypothetical protein